MSTNNIAKQIFIALLTIIAVALVLALIFYQYIPTNKMVPAKVQAYSTPQNVETEISDNVTEQKYETTNQVYEVTDSDLNNYKDSKSYNPGKSDPFSAYSASDDNSNTVSNSTGVSEGDGAKSSTTVNSDAKDNYYEQAGINKGTK